MMVALRDDDACYFTSPESLERVYAGIWEYVPVCLAVVPFAIGYRRPGIPEAHWSDGQAFGLERNPALVERLKTLVRENRVTIALHGYTHQDFPNGFEFQAAPDSARRVHEGRKYLQRLLESAISIFVPPHNALSRAGLEAVRRERLNLLGSFLSFHPRSRRWEWRTAHNWWLVARYRARTGRSKADAMVFPHVLRYGRHAEFGCHGLVPGIRFEQLTRGFDEARRAGGHFCLATHHWEVDAELQDLLRRFLDYAAQYPDVEFAAAEALFRT